MVCAVILACEQGVTFTDRACAITGRAPSRTHAVHVSAFAPRAGPATSAVVEVPLLGKKLSLLPATPAAEGAIDGVPQHLGLGEDTTDIKPDSVLKPENVPAQTQLRYQNLPENGPAFLLSRNLQALPKKCSSISRSLRRLRERLKSRNQYPRRIKSVM